MNESDKTNTTSRPPQSNTTSRPPKSNTSRPPKGPGGDEKTGEQNSLFDKFMRDGVIRGLDSFIKEGKLRNLVSELKMPREIVTHIITQVDETKQAAVSVIAREVRVFLEQTNLADELAKLLTQISFQIKTEISFVPNDDAIKNPDKKPKKKPGIDIRSSWWPKRTTETPDPPKDDLEDIEEENDSDSEGDKNDGVK